MFKSSTALFLALALCAPLAPAQEKKPLQMQNNAPDRYIVVKGDTLWDISGKFLKDPWRWPEIWGLNKEQIKDPHWIYPGDVIVFDRNAMQLRLSRNGDSGAAADTPCVRTAGAPSQDAMRGNKLVPCIREQTLIGEAIPTIPAKLIEPFLSQPLVTDAGGLEKAPTIVATQEGRVNLGTGNIAYASGLGDKEGDTWNIYRKGPVLIDPETKVDMGQEAVFLGTARVIKGGDPATLRITSSKREIGAGDYLLPATPPKVFNYSPHAPLQPVRGRVMSIYDGNVDTRSEFYGGKRDPALDITSGSLAETGLLSIITINRGAKDGIEVGSVLALYRGTVLPNDRSTGPFYMGDDKLQPVSLPEERFGLIMVFRTFDKVSYALIVQAERPVAPNDLVLNP